MKNWNLWFLLAIIIIVYFGSGAIDKIVSGLMQQKDRIELMRGELSAISKRLNADDKDKAIFYKLQKNQDVWSGTACLNCHATIDTALPINKISVSEAMEIVRKGNERTRAGGMPIYTARATRDRNSITDADLKVRLDALYTKELLEYAKDTKPQLPEAPR